MKNVTIVSADGHSVMPTALWRQYLEPQYHEHLAQFEAENAVVFAGAGGEKDDGNGGKPVMTAQAAAYVEPVSAGDHDVEKKEGRRLTFGVGNYVGGGMKQAHIETGCFQMMLHQPRDVGVVFQHKYGLAQTVCPSFTPRRSPGGC